MQEKRYDRKSAVEYARKWAFLRNPQYFDFDKWGGDCTSFVSQCIFSGSKIMNFSQYGWYYKSGYDKSASWSGVEFLGKFLMENKAIGPQGEKCDISEVEIGDIAQISFDGNKFSHTAIIVNISEKNLENIFVATHTEDSYNRQLSTYPLQKVRFIKIKRIMF